MLEVKDIYKDYDGKPLLRGVSMQVAQGETVCLLGASGSGKSTLLRIIAGLETQEAGQVLWDGDDISQVPVHKRHFGLMFQDYALFPAPQCGRECGLWPAYAGRGASRTGSAGDGGIGTRWTWLLLLTGA